MKVTINPTLQEVYNYFSLFNGLINYDFFKRQMTVQWASEFDENLESYANKLFEDRQYEDAKYLIGMNMLTRTMFLDPMLIHESKTLDEYYETIRNKSIDDYKKYILNKLDITSSDQMFEALDNLELNSDEKWFYMSLYNNPLKYIEIFIHLSKNAEKICKDVEKGYCKEFKDFVEWMNDKVSEDDIEYIINTLEFLNLREFNELEINYSMFDLSSLHQYAEDKAILTLGIMFRRYNERKSSIKDIEVHLNTYKVISDPTRFEILRILAKKESYGQELAESLDVSTATISYHMEFLFGASLVTINRKHRRLYYALNKEQLSKSMNFINELFELDKPCVKTEEDSSRKMFFRHVNLSIN